MGVEKEKFYQIEESKEGQKAVEIDPEFLRQLQIIAERVGGDSGMKIEIGIPGEGSFFNPIENKITLDPFHIQEDPQLAQFVSAHEGGHRAITRGPHEIGLKDEKIKEIYSEIGFAYGLNCCEDPADNNWISKKFEGLKPIVGETYDKMLETENVPLGMDHPEVRQAVAMLGYVPKFVYFGSEIIRDWHQEKFSKDLDPQVLKSLEKAREDFRKFFGTIPSDIKTEKETLEKARERFLNFYENVWPEMKKIVEMDINDEKLRQMAEQMKNEIMDKLDKKEKNEMKDAMENSQKGLEKEIENTEKELENSQKAGEKTQKEIDKLNKKIEKADGEEKEKLQKELEQKENEQKQNQKNQEETKKQVEQMKQSQEKGGQPMPMDKLSQKLKEKLQEIFDNLPEEEKNKLEQKAKEQLGKVEDEANKDKAGKLNQDKIESHEETRIKADEESEIKQKRKREQEEIEKAKEELRKKIEKEMNHYDREHRELKLIIDNLYQELEKIFIPMRNPRWKKGFPSGSRLDLLKAMQFEADRSKYGEIWERKTIPKKIDYKFMILVDMSGSMEGENIKETFRGLIVLAEVLNRLGIGIEIAGFSDERGVEIYKAMEEDLNKDRRDEISKIIERVGGGTPTGRATKIASEELEKNKGKDNFLVTLTDGGATDIRPEQLKKLINDLSKKNNQKFVGLGLGDGTDFVEQVYPAAKGNIKVEDLPIFLSQLLGDMIKNPEKY